MITPNQLNSGFLYFSGFFFFFSKKTEYIRVFNVKKLKKQIFK